MLVQLFIYDYIEEKKSLMSGDKRLSPIQVLIIVILQM